MSPRLGTLSVVLGVTAAGLVAVPVAAAAAAASCHGQVATLVGDPALPKLTGTDGPDVMVSNGSPMVFGGAGDDVICTTGTVMPPGGGPIGNPLVDAGDGDDLVDTTGDTTGKTTGATPATFLGAGDDVFVGGAGPDLVNASDVGHDEISAGDGADYVSSGSTDGPDNDAIDLGEGDDVANLDHAVGPETTIAGGGGTDGMSGPGERTGAWVFDNQLGEARSNGVVQLRWTGLERFSPDSSAGSPGSAAFIGTAEDESFFLFETTFAGAEMGPGDDEVALYMRELTTGAPLAGDQGRDRLVAAPVRGPGASVTKLRLSLNRGLMRYVYVGGNRARVHASGFEDAEVAAPRVRLSGDAGDNRLWWSGCRVVVLGGAGADTIRWRYGGSRCEEPRFQVYGNTGDDHLTGSPRTDHLIGGSGNDRVDGKRGRDYCQAEWTRDCEVSVP